MTLKQDCLDNMQEMDIVISPETTHTHYYPEYAAPLAVRRFSDVCRVGPCPGANGILFVHEGTVRIGETGPTIAAHFLAPVDRFSNIQAKSEGWLAVYRPAVINQAFASWPTLPAGIDNDPYLKRDRELLESVLPSPDQNKNRYLVLTPDEDQFLLRMFSSLTNLLEDQQDVYWPCRSRSFFLEILLFFRQRPDPTVQHVQRSKAQQVHDWLRTHYPDNITLPDLARFFGSNRTTLQEQFRKEYGGSIMGVLSQIRVEAATILMRNTELTLSEISFRTGFGDYSNFYREFQRRKKMSPKDYRAQVATVQIY